MMKTSGMGDYHLVLAVGPTIYADFVSEFAPGSTTTLPGNCTIYQWVDQPAMLQRSAVIYTHGGLATLKEAIWHEVPIVVVPQGKDQQDNALRMRRQGLGLVAQRQDLSPLGLRQFFTSAVSSRWMKGNLAKAHALLATWENPASGVKESLQYIDQALTPAP